MEGPSLSAEGKLVMPEVRSRNGENSRAVGLAWKALSREEKQRWEAESQKDLKRYQAECAQAGVEPKLYSHVAGQLRNARRAVRPVDNAGGAGLVDPKAAYKVTGNIPRIGFAGATRPSDLTRDLTRVVSGALEALAPAEGLSFAYRPLNHVDPDTGAFVCGGTSDCESTLPGFGCSAQ